MPRSSKSSRKKRNRAQHAVRTRYTRQNHATPNPINGSTEGEHSDSDSMHIVTTNGPTSSPTTPIFADFPGSILPVHRFRQNIPHSRPLEFRLLSIRTLEHLMGKLRMKRADAIRHVCSISQISKSTLERWIYLTKMNGLPSDFPSDTIIGRPPLLSDTQLKLLDEFLQQESITSSLHQGKALNAPLIIDWIHENMSISISSSTLQLVLKKLGYSWTDPSVPDPRASYNKTGHDRTDVVQYRQETFVDDFLRYYRDPNVIFICQDESMVHCNQHARQYYIKFDEKGSKWASKHQKLMAQKLTKRGANYSVMVSCYMCEHEVHVECLKRIKRGGSHGRKTFNNQDFMDQFQSAIHYFGEKYPNKELVFLFDNAPNHKVKIDGVNSSQIPTWSQFGENTLPDFPFDSKYDTLEYFGLLPDDVEYVPEPQKPALQAHQARQSQLPEQFESLPKWKCHLSDQWKSYRKWKTDSQKKIKLIDSLFKNSLIWKNFATKLEELAVTHGARVLFTPFYHAELNPIELVWGRMKQMLRMKQINSQKEIFEIIPVLLRKINRENCPVKSYRRVLSRVVNYKKFSKIVLPYYEYKSLVHSISDIPNPFGILERYQCNYILLP